MKSVAFCISSQSLFANVVDGKINPAVQKSILQILSDHFDLQRLILLPFDLQALEDQRCINALQALQRELQKMFLKRNVNVFCSGELSFNERIREAGILAHGVTFAFALMHSGIQPVDEFNFFVESKRAYKELQSVFQGRFESPRLIADDVVARFHRTNAGVLTGRDFFQIGTRVAKPDLCKVLLPMAKSCQQLARFTALAPSHLESFSREVVLSPSLADLSPEEENMNIRMYDFFRRHSLFYYPKRQFVAEDKVIQHQKLVNSV